MTISNRFAAVAQKTAKDEKTFEGEVVVLGGGLAGMASAYSLARAGARVTLIEAASELGGLAGSFEMAGNVYPLGYHHILEGDHCLRDFLREIGVEEQIEWRRSKLLLEVGNRLVDLASVSGMLRLRLDPISKLRLGYLMLRSFLKKDWSDWRGRGADELIEQWAGSRVREVLFEPLTQLKFELECSETSAAWLGARLHAREGSTPFGYIPGANWTEVLCSGLTRLLEEQGVRILTSTRVIGLAGGDGSLFEATTDRAGALPADVFVSGLPTTSLAGVLDGRIDAVVADIEYSALISTLFVTAQKPPKDFYWLSLLSPDTTAGALFNLSDLNPEIGGPGETCLNFVSHMRGSSAELFQRTEEELVELYRKDFFSLFGFELEPKWSRCFKIPTYSPVFDRSYENPPVQSEMWRNLFLCGNYRTFPSVASTGTALQSGLEAAETALRFARHRAEVESLTSLPKTRSIGNVV